ncbi:MAG TPA: hypothetical protein VGM03_16600 [Phycisphaerae bacterium]
MSVRFFVDMHVRRELVVGLRLRGVEVLTAQEDGSDRLADDALLNRALFSQDEDLIREAVRCQREGTTFTGLIYVHQLAITIGQCVRDLELIANVYEPEDLINRIEYLPLR